MIQVADVGVGISGQEGMQVKTDGPSSVTSLRATSSHVKGWPQAQRGPQQLRWKGRCVVAGLGTAAVRRRPL